MKQGFCRGLEEAVVKLHEGQGQDNVQLKKFVCSPQGWPLLLVRWKDANWNWVYCIDFFHPDPKENDWQVEPVYCGTKEDVKDWIRIWTNPSPEFQSETLYDTIRELDGAYSLPKGELCE